MKFFYLFVFSLISISLNAQFQDDFSDGNFSQNPEWLGDISEFTINTDNQLQLNGSGSDTSYMVIESNILVQNEWNIWLRMSFAPSVNNNLRIYLMADVANLKGPLNGYYLLFGENGSDDSIDLFRQDGDNHTKIIDGIPGNCSSSNTIRIKVTKTDLGLWNVFSDLTGNFSFLPEGEITDNTYTSSGYFGLFCKYTSSNATKFYFDDFYSGEIQIDSIPPKIVSFNLPSNHEINILFSEAISQVTAQTIENYNMSNGFGNPSSINFDALNPIELTLNFANSFISENNYELTISNISDVNENIIADTTINFSWFEVSANNIVINEIMADPNPVVALPEQEYIELYNNSSFDISISGWILDIGGVEKNIPTSTILSNNYILLCATGSVTDLQNYGTAVGVPAFQGLTNSGQTIKIKTNEGLLISEVEYNIAWYQDEDKNDGGWSLERIDPNNNCGQMNNWQASTDISGGSPGRENSIFNINIDNITPNISNFYILDSNIISIEFSEEILPDSANNIKNYQLVESLIFPETVSIIENNLVEIIFSEAFVQNTEISLRVSNISDYCENISNDTVLNFVYYQPKQWDILINEIMADPSPSVDLPETEYIELINTSAFPININDWWFCTSSKEKQLESATIMPGELLILCPVDMCNQFGPFVNCMDILGSSDLSNDGNILSLKDKNKNIISAVEYSINMYNDDYKAEGGWSLERIDPTNFCDASNNWSASEHKNGGTPGTSNSLLGDNFDNTDPNLVRAYAISNNSINIIFSESLDSLSLISPDNFFVNHNIGNPISANPVEPLFQSVILEFADTFIQNQVYTISVSSISDCAQNSNSSILETRFALPQTIEPNEIVINEILFNPAADGVDYIEIYNRTTKTFDLSELILANWDENNQVAASHKTVSENPYLIFPDEYVVLTSSKIKTIEYFYESDENAFIEPDISIPSMPNESGRIILFDKSLTTIDYFDYAEDMQFDLLNSFEGVALERINYNLPTNDRNNWHSAAETVGFGTPGLPNSQFVDISEIETKLQVEPEIFSPDNDGYQDILTISYSFDKAGFVGTITIYDAKGRLIKQIADNVLLSTSGNFTWDGITDFDRKARIGIYLIYFEYFDLQGNVHKEKSTCVLATKLN